MANFPYDLVAGEFVNLAWTLQVSLEELEAYCPGVALEDTVEICTTFVGHFVPDPDGHNGFLVNSTNGVSVSTSASNTWSGPSGATNQTIGNASTESDAVPVDRSVCFRHTVADLVAGIPYSTFGFGCVSCPEGLADITIELTAVGECSGVERLSPRRRTRTIDPETIRVELGLDDPFVKDEEVIIERGV